jgi:hypothetical protein
VAAADADGDGDMDLFVGTLADSRAYGVPQTSYLLLNNGNAQFTIAGNDVMPLQNIGMVTCAAFADVNKDGAADVVVTGEWMPLTFHQQKRTVRKNDYSQFNRLVANRFCR